MAVDTQHEKYPGHGLTLQQLMHALNEELSAQITSGQLAADPDGVRISSVYCILTHCSDYVPSSPI